MAPQVKSGLLACDQDGDDVLPAGWPESSALASDCTLVEAATDDARLEMLNNAAQLQGLDRRCRVARHQLAAPSPSSTPTTEDL